jgi:outer membrane protein assembly factor BamB
MKSPICVTNICVTNRKQTASFRIAGLMLVIAPLLLLLGAAGTSVQAQTTPSPADWTQFLRDNMQRWNPYETVLGVNNVSGLKLKWSFTTNDDLGFNEGSSTAVVNGVAYFGSVDNNVYALNASTGAKLWSYMTAGFVDSSPAVVNGVVYIGSDDGNVYALNASTGAVLWSFTTGGRVESSPTVVNGVVYIGSDDDNVYALDARTGKKLWSYLTNSEVNSSTPAVVNGVVYVGSGDNNNSLIALNAGTGAKLWSYAEGSGVAGSPAVANGVVYFSDGEGTAHALNASTGASLWAYQNIGGGTPSTPAVANGVVYFSDAGIFALNVTTGTLLWRLRPGATASASPAVANGVVYFGDEEGYQYALNANTGALLWSYFAGGAVGSSPVVVDGIVYGASGPRFYAFGLGAADLFLRIRPSPTPVHQGDLLTYAFPVWNLGPGDAVHEVLNTQVPEGTTLDYVRISGTPGLGTCTTPPYEGTGEIVCHENSAMAPNTTWTVRLIVKVTASKGTVITENAATTADTPDPNLANNTATVSTTVQ